MATIDLSQKLVGASASYQAQDWAQIGAAGGLDFRGQAQLKRGFDLQLGVQALVALDASFQKFLAAQGHAYATASAGIRAQMQVPLDLFDEAGAAIRLEAAAQAAVGIRLSLGLSIGDFIALAQADPRMTGLPMKLLRIFLEELVVEGGYMAKLAYSAMAYAKLSLTGTLIQKDGKDPGFTMAGEFGAGLKGGTGHQVFANFGIGDPRRLIRRSVDVSVDETVAQLRPYIEDPTQRMLLYSLKAPAKMALRTGFELGLELSRSSGTFDASAGPRLAQRCVQVILEEGQRFLFERLVLYATDAFDAQMAALGVSQQDWDRTAAARAHLASLLGQIPAEPFEITMKNRRYWTDVVSAAIDLVTELTQTAPPADLQEALSVLWVAGELMFISVERISEAQARVSLLGLPPLQASAAFSGPFTGPQPPTVLRRHINAAANKPPDAPLTQDVMVDFLVRDTLLAQLRQRFPDVDPVLDIVAGPQGIGLTAAARSIFRNIGAFAPGADGSPDPEASLRILADGLRAYIDARLVGELVPAIHAATGNRPELRLYVDEVFVPTLLFTVEVVFDRVVNWSTGNLDGQTALREACSSIVMKLVGRSLVVTTDLIVAAAQSEIRGELLRAADHVDDQGGVAHRLSQALPVDRAVIAEVIEETMHIAAEVLGPLPPETRQKMRALLYEVVDTLPADPDPTFLDELRHSFFVPNIDTATALAAELSEIMARNLETFVARVLQRVAELALAELQELMDQAAAEIAAWIGAMEDLARALLDRLVELAREIQALLQALEERWNQALDDLDRLLRLVGHGSNRNTVRQSVRSLVLSNAKAALSTNFFYANLPKPGRNLVDTALTSAVHATLDSVLFDTIWDVVGGIAVESADIIEDLRGLDPQQDLTAAVLTLFLDRVEDRVRSAFGHGNPGIPLRFQVKGNYTPVTYVFGRRVELPPVAIDVTIDLGTVHLPLNQLINALRSAIASIGAAENLARSVAQNLLAAFAAEGELAAAEAERSTVQEQERSVREQLQDTQAGDFNVAVLAPAPASYHERSVECLVALSNVPRSFLGLGFGEQPRVLVWLNETPIDIARFAVEETASNGQDDVAVDPGRAMPVAAVIGRVTGYMRDVPPADCGQPASRVRKGTAGKNDGTGGPKAQVPVSARDAAIDRLRAATGSSRSVQRRMTGDRDAASSDPFQLSGLVAARSGATERARMTLLGAGTAHLATGRRGPQSRASAGELRWGRSLHRSDILRLVAEAMPDLLLRLALPLSELEAGINTLTVAVIDGRDNRVEQSVSFVAGQPSNKRPSLTLAALGDLSWEMAGARIIGDREREVETGRNAGGAQPPGPPADDGKGPREIPTRERHWVKPRAEREKARRQGWAGEQHRMRGAVTTIRELGSTVREGRLRPERTPPPGDPPTKGSAGTFIRQQAVSDIRTPPAGDSTHER